MLYSAEYTRLIEGATWGREDREFEAESNEEAIKIALEIESNWLQRYDNGEVAELLLDYIYDENGKEVEWERE